MTSYSKGYDGLIFFPASSIRKLGFDLIVLVFQILVQFIAGYFQGLFPVIQPDEVNILPAIFTNHLYRFYNHHEIIYAGDHYTPALFHITHLYDSIIFIALYFHFACGFELGNGFSFPPDQR